MKVWKRWPGSDAVAKPLAILPFTASTEWNFEPVEPAVCVKTGEALWDRSEPAWTPPYIIAANLNVGTKAVIASFKDWLVNERKRTGIPSPRGGRNQGIGKKVWRFLEELDLRAAGLSDASRGESGPSLRSKADALWKALQADPAPYAPHYFFRVAVSEIAKHGKIRKGKLPLRD